MTDDIPFFFPMRSQGYRPHSYPALPLMTAICPTANRHTLLARCIASFLAQDYPRKELIILEDGAQCNESVVEGLGPHSGITYHYSPGHTSIGAKRNLACSLAHGEYLVGLDDDDYSGPARLSQQVQPLLCGAADCSAMRMSLLLTLDSGIPHLWHCSDSVHASLFPYDVRAGTLMFPASLWRDGLRYD